MTLPGHTVTIGSRVAAPSDAPSTSNGFLVGFSEKGPVGVPIPLVSISDFAQKLGPRYATKPLGYDCADAAFHEGASLLYFSRVVGEGALASSAYLKDSEGKKTLKASAMSQGEWGNNLKIVVTGTTEVVLTVKEGATVVEVSPTFTDVASAISWSSHSNYIRLAAGGESTKLPKAEETSLSGGKAEAGKAGATELKAALDALATDLGPGQLLAPDFSTEANQKAIGEHVEAHDRCALLNNASDEVEGLTKAAIAMRANVGCRFCSLWAPWAEIPGLSTGTHREVPWAAVQMGLIARAESLGQNPNRAAAGKYGRARWATGLKTLYTDAQREELNSAGVSVAILKHGVPTTYGDRSLVHPTNDPDWRYFSNSRLIMAASSSASDVMDQFLFEQIDGRGQLFTDLEGALRAAMMEFYLANALYGQTPDEAFVVNTGPDVNTPTTIAAGELRAQIGLRVSEDAEVLSTEIIKVPITEALT